MQDHTPEKPITFSDFSIFIVHFQQSNRNTVALKNYAKFSLASRPA